MFLNPFGLQLVTANGINETFSSWTLWKVQKDKRKLWQSIRSYYIEKKKKNRRCFEGEATLISALIARCLLNLHGWEKCFELIFGFC